MLEYAITRFMSLSLRATKEPNKAEATPKAAKPYMKTVAKVVADIAGKMVPIEIRIIA